VVITIAGGSSGAANGTGHQRPVQPSFWSPRDAFWVMSLAGLPNNAIRLGAAAGSPASKGSVQLRFLLPRRYRGRQVGVGWRRSVPDQRRGYIHSDCRNPFHQFHLGFRLHHPGAADGHCDRSSDECGGGRYATAVANAGSLEVMISPAGAISAGAEWQVDGGAFAD